MTVEPSYDLGKNAWDFAVARKVWESDVVRASYQTRNKNLGLEWSRNSKVNGSFKDQVGGLQVLYEAEWLDVKPVPGALVINIGDILQIISNDEYKSGEHKVLANPFQMPRVSIAVFLNPSNGDGLFGPLPELDPFASQAKRKKCSVSEKSELYQYFEDMARMALLDNGVCRTSELLLLISR